MSRNFGDHIESVNREMLIQAIDDYPDDTRRLLFSCRLLATLSTYIDPDLMHTCITVAQHTERLKADA